MLVRRPKACTGALPKASKQVGKRFLTRPTPSARAHTAQQAAGRHSPPDAQRQSQCEIGHGSGARGRHCAALQPPKVAQLPKGKRSFLVRNTAARWCFRGGGHGTRTPLSPRTRNPEVTSRRKIARVGARTEPQAAGKGKSKETPSSFLVGAKTAAAPPAPPAIPRVEMARSPRALGSRQGHISPHPHLSRLHSLGQGLESLRKLQPVRPGSIRLTDDPAFADLGCIGTWQSEEHCLPLTHAP